jgi:hypothetical protein
LTGAAAFCWAIWITRNDAIFDKGYPKTFLQVLFRETHWLRFWALLQCSDDDKERILDAFKLLESRAMGSSHRMDDLSFTVLNFSSEPVRSFSYGCATVIRLD